MARFIQKSLSPVLLFLSLILPGLAEESRQPPNILLILADDLGVEGLSAYGGTSYATPRLDQLATEGMRFTHAFSTPYCSPTRASLLTGRYPFRNGIQEVIYDLDRHGDLFLQTDQPSVARQLQEAGYATAIAGKWQLSFLHQRDLIREFGFDQNQCWQIFAEDGSKTRRFHQPHYKRNGRILEGVKDRYGPDLNVEFLMAFMSESVARKTPFFAYHCSLLPHFPWVPTPDSANQKDPLQSATGQGDPAFFPDMVTYLDTCVGRLLDHLEVLGVADNTLVVFLADNGTDRRITSRWGIDKVIQGGKSTPTDRGTRVPLIVRWPGTVEPGSVASALVDVSDFLPTLCAIAGAPLPQARLDGSSFLPVLQGHTESVRDWVHVEKKDHRHVRNRDYILTLQGNLRPVVEIWQDPAPPLPPGFSPEAEASRQQLEAAFQGLGAPFPSGL